MEQWKEVPGWSGKYLVSNHGRMRIAKPNGTFKEMRSRDTLGYRRVSLGPKGCQVFKNVHQIVALAFLDQPEGKTIINHKNSIKHDNRAENLEWCTQKENVRHAHSAGRVKAGMCGLAGVRRRNLRFEASIKIGGKGLYIGTFDCPVIAHKKYLDKFRECA